MTLVSRIERTSVAVMVTVCNLKDSARLRADTAHACTDTSYVPTVLTAESCLAKVVPVVLMGYNSGWLQVHKSLHLPVPFTQAGT